MLRKTTKLFILIILPTVIYLYLTSPSQSLVRPKIEFFSKNEKRSPTVSGILATKKSNYSSSSGLHATQVLKRRQSAKKATKALKTANSEKFLMYLCDGRKLCGGLSDRQRGIAYAFMVALQLDRKFGIIMSTPCDIRQFFIPNKYNWIIAESALVGKSQKIIKFMHRGIYDLSNETAEVIYLKSSTLLYCDVYRQIEHKLPPYLKGGTTRTQIFKLIWESLMKPSRHVINRLKTIALRENMTCAHVRIGQSENLPNDASKNNITNVPKLWEFMDKLDTANKIFIATDNIEVRNTARRRFGKRYFDSEGKILHIDRQKGMDADCLGFETAVVDQIILSKCKVLIVSKSGFSELAASIRNDPKELYKFQRSNIFPLHFPEPQLNGSHCTRMKPI
ncbi:hypothetical protein LOTGIDRAFT_172851 [Lottia gigantea]|uniref:GT23 domain-containing protein n=1 Tax=Lottia gigantea TaxID=225164 RepID=V4B138_LOTGI|nr:hypothetical protein LOTGIDRAFT_172851 [Lottia gigantea]ESP01016.1 hypothetical protein LOTGIDRAFT_172851 [Lottia gigantea]